MEALFIDVSELRKAIRDSISTLPNTTVHRSLVNNNTSEDACYVCSEDWHYGDEMVRPKCQCPYWLHEACLAKAMFEAGGCPSCRIPTHELDEAFLLGSAADSGDVSKATRLLRNGAPPSPRFLDNSTPLIRAGRHGQKEVLRILIDHGASISEQDNQGRTAIHWAVLNKHKDAVEELVQEEDLQGVDKMGNTLLHLAVRSRSVEMVALVLDRGASTSAQDYRGRTALHLATEGGEYEMIKPLVAKGALVDTRDKLGRTPLHYAARNGMSTTAKELLDAGAADSIVDSAGCVPWDLANDQYCIGVRRVLEGGDVPFDARYVRYAIEE